MMRMINWTGGQEWLMTHELWLESVMPDQAENIKSRYSWGNLYAVETFMIKPLWSTWYQTFHKYVLTAYIHFVYLMGINMYCNTTMWCDAVPVSKFGIKMVKQIINQLLMLAKNKAKILSDVFIFFCSMPHSTEMPKNCLAVFTLSKGN